jgi:hypothetical protein
MEIQKGNIRARLFEKADGPFTGARLAHHHKIVLRLEELSEPVQDDLVIVDQEEANR